MIAPHVQTALADESDFSVKKSAPAGKDIREVGFAVCTCTPDVAAP